MTHYVCNVQPPNSTFMDVIKGNVRHLWSKTLLPTYLYLLQLRASTKPKTFFELCYDLPIYRKKNLAFLPVPRPRTQSQNKQQRQQKNAEASNSTRGKMTHEISSFRWLRNDDDIISRDGLRYSYVSLLFGSATFFVSFPGPCHIGLITQTGHYLLISYQKHIVIYLLYFINISVIVSFSIVFNG